MQYPKCQHNVWLNAHDEARIALWRAWAWPSACAAVQRQEHGAGIRASALRALAPYLPIPGWPN
jgi:hypothetical protein